MSVVVAGVPAQNEDALRLQAADVVGQFRKRGFGPFTGVPCSYLGPVISYLQSEWPENYLVAANEGEAVAIAAGARLAGRRPVVVLQNSGLGNAVNPLTSLCHTLSLPVLLLVTWRGRPGMPDEPQHEIMGKITPELLTLMGVRNEVLPTDPELLAERLSAADEYMESTRLPFAFIVAKGSIASYTAPPETAPEHLMRRAEAIGVVVRSMSPESCLIATTGKTARELERDWDRPRNLYMVGSMGCASSVALGVALYSEQDSVVVLDGDGAALMRLEALATIGREAPANLLHIILDNEAYESTGGQPTGSGSVDFAALAKGCGYRSTQEIAEAGALEQAIAVSRTSCGPHLIRVRIASGSDPELGRPALLPPESATRFMEAIAR